MSSEKVGQAGLYLVRQTRSRVTNSAWDRSDRQATTDTDTDNKVRVSRTLGANFFGGDAHVCVQHNVKRYLYYCLIPALSAGGRYEEVAESHVRFFSYSPYVQTKGQYLTFRFRSTQFSLLPHIS